MGSDYGNDVAPGKTKTSAEKKVKRTGFSAGRSVGRDLRGIYISYVIILFYNKLYQKIVHFNFLIHFSF